MLHIADFGSPVPTLPATRWPRALVPFACAASLHVAAAVLIVSVSRIQRHPCWSPSGHRGSSTPMKSGSSCSLPATRILQEAEVEVEAETVRQRLSDTPRVLAWIQSRYGLRSRPLPPEPQRTQQSCPKFSWMRDRSLGQCRCCWTPGGRRLVRSVNRARFRRWRRRRRRDRHRTGTRAGRRRRVRRRSWRRCVPSGGSVTAPQVIFEVKPTYTNEALTQKIQGSVVLELVVQADGLPSDIRVVRSLDPGGLDQQAIIAASQWRFEPGRLSGRPVNVLVTLMLDFRIR